MTPEFLSLEEPVPGAACPVCGEPVRLIAYCGACAEREAAEELAHERRRDDPLRLAETRTILDLAEARRRTREHVCAKCSDKFSPGGVERM